MIALSTTTPIRWTPPWREGQDGAPVYLLRAGSVVDRAAFEAELSGEYQAGRVYAGDVATAAIQGIEAIMADDPGRDEIVELVRQEAAGETLTAEGRQALVRVRRALAKSWPEYAELLAQGQRRREMMPLLAFRRFVVGWEGLAVAFERGRDGLVTETALAGIDSNDLIGVGSHAYGLLYAGDQRANFTQLSPSEDPPNRSRSDDMSKAGGKSKGRAGLKTPA